MTAKLMMSLQLKVGSLYKGQVIFLAKHPVTTAECLTGSFQEVQQFAKKQGLMLDFVVDEYFAQLEYLEGQGWAIKEKYLDPKQVQWSAIEYLTKLQKDNF